MHISPMPVWHHYAESPRTSDYFLQYSLFLFLLFLIYSIEQALQLLHSFYSITLSVTYSRSAAPPFLWYSFLYFWRGNLSIHWQGECVCERPSISHTLHVMTGSIILEPGSHKLLGREFSWENLGAFCFLNIETALLNNFLTFLLQALELTIY